MGRAELPGQGLVGLSWLGWAGFGSVWVYQARTSSSHHLGHALTPPSLWCPSPAHAGPSPLVLGTPSPCHAHVTSTPCLATCPGCWPPFRRCPTPGQPHEPPAVRGHRPGPHLPPHCPGGDPVSTPLIVNLGSCNRSRSSLWDVHYSWSSSRSPESPGDTRGRERHEAGRGQPWLPGSAAQSHVPMSGTG